MLYVICMKFLWLNNIIHDYLLLDISNFIYMCRVYLQEFWSIKYIPQCALNVGISNIEFKILWDQIISKLLQIGSKKKNNNKKEITFHNLLKRKVQNVCCFYLMLFMDINIIYNIILSKKLDKIYILYYDVPSSHSQYPIQSSL